MCTFCGTITVLYEGAFGDWVCIACLNQERLECEIDDCCDTGNDVLGDLEQCILNGTF